MEKFVFDLVLFSLLLTAGGIAIVCLGVVLDEGPRGLQVKFIALKEMISTSCFYNALVLRGNLIIAVAIAIATLTAISCFIERPIYSATCTINIEGQPGLGIQGPSCY